MTFHQPYLENPLKMNSMNIPSSNMIRNVTNTRPTSDPSFIQNKAMLLQQNNPYVKSMIYENRDNTYSDILNQKTMGSKSLYLNNTTTSNNNSNNSTGNNNYKSSEAEAIDKIFEDLSYYEKTLEEMANAQLDDDFKEEMAAIEQWFIVLSECERTTVLYSLIQNISELQVRFFLTLLQQKVKSNPLFNSIIKRPISDSIYSSTSTKHCSNTSSENSSMIHSSSTTDTYYDDEDYQNNSFVDATKSSSSQFNCPLNMNEFNMAMNSLSNANFLNERTSSLARPTSKSHTSASVTNHHQSTPAANNATPAATAAATSRKNSYMNTMMNDYSNVNVNVNVTSPNLNVLGNMNNMNRYNVNDSVLLNGMSNATSSNPTAAMMNSQFLPLNNNTSFTNNLPLLNQNTINSLMNPYNTNSSTTSALPVLSSNSTLGLGSAKDDIYTASTKQTSPRVSPIQPPKPSNANKTEGKEVTETKMETSTTTTTTTATVNKTTVKNRPRNKSLTQILLTNMEVKEGSKNASILTDILNLSKEMNDMVNKNKERAKKEKTRATTTQTTSTAPTSPKVKKSNTSEDGAESVVGSTTNTVTPSREKGKIPDQIDLEMLEDIPVFLRSLRLHKYAPAFEGLNWKQMIRLDNDELLSRGVSALGARNKMLKVFDLIRAEAIKQNVSLEC